jgi:multicomponent Na+:H+ antiporter subunit G
MQEILSMILMVSGAILMLIAAVGMLRFPDLYMRISAATKASTLGVGFLLLALALHFNELGITSRSLATIAFIAVTSPVAAHLISRSAYISGTPLWKESRIDELKGRYDEKTCSLKGLSAQERNQPPAQ